MAQPDAKGLTLTQVVPIHTTILHKVVHFITLYHYNVYLKEVEVK